MNSIRKASLIIVKSEPLCDLLPLAFEPMDTGLPVYALPATPQQTTTNVNTFAYFLYTNYIVLQTLEYFFQFAYFGHTSAYNCIFSSILAYFRY